MDEKDSFKIQLHLNHLIFRPLEEKEDAEEEWRMLNCSVCAVPMFGRNKRQERENKVIF